MIVLLSLITLVLIIMMLPFKSKYQVLEYIRENFLVPMSVLSSTLAFVYLEDFAIYIFPVQFLLFSYFSSLKDNLTEEGIYEYFFILMIYVIFGLLQSPVEYSFVFALIYTINLKFINKPIELFLLFVTVIVLIFFSSEMSALWAKFSNLLLLPILILLAFENRRDKLSQLNIVFIIIFLTKVSLEYLPGYYLVAGMFLILISIIRDLDSFTRAVFIGCGLYLSFFMDRNPLILLPIVFLILEKIYFKRIFLREMNKIELDKEKFSIGYNQIVIFVTLFILFSGLHFSPVSILYSLSSMSFSVVLIFLMIDFPYITVDAIKGRMIETGVKEDVSRAIVLILCFIPLSIKITVYSYFYQLIALVLTVLLYFYMQKNKRFADTLSRVYQKLKTSASLLPGSRKFNCDTISKEPFESSESNFRLTLDGISSTYIFSIYLLLATMVVFWMVG